MIQKYSVFHNESVEVCDLYKLKNIADELSNRMYCDRFGSCVHFAELFVDAVYDTNPKMLDCFDVIEGYVTSGSEHTWIEVGDVKIDPTFVQFTDSVDYMGNGKRYSGRKYYEDRDDDTWFRERRERFPNQVFKNV